MRRTKSLVSAILATVANLFLLAIVGWAMILVTALVQAALENDETAKVAAIVLLAEFILTLLVILVALILNCVIFSFVNSTPEKYAKKKAVLITTIVFNFLVALMCIIAGVQTEFISYIVIYILLAALLVTANVLYIWDLKEEKVRVQSMVAPKILSDSDASSDAQEASQQSEPKNLEQSKSPEDAEDNADDKQDDDNP